jgi:hypothetical protein
VDRQPPKSPRPTRLQALIWGRRPAGDIGATRTREGWDIFARSAVVTYASAFNLQAIDMRSTSTSEIKMGWSEKPARSPAGVRRQADHPPP